MRNFSCSTTEHVTVANIYCQKLPRSYVYGALLTWSVCVCVCHEELVWLSAMQLEAIIEPITFCLLLSFALPRSSLLSLSFSSSLSSAPIFCLSDFNSAGLSLCEPRPNFTVNPWILPSLTSSLHRLIQLCTVSHAAATLARLPLIQSFLNCYTRIIISFN